MVVPQGTLAHSLDTAVFKSYKAIGNDSKNEWCFFGVFILAYLLACRENLCSYEAEPSLPYAIPLCLQFPLVGVNKRFINAYNS